MKLFNPYQNQIYIELINYINGCMSNNIEPLSKQDFIETILIEKLHLSESLIQAVTENFMFFEPDSDSYVPILNREHPLPVPLSIPELTWLKYVLSDYKAELFVEDRARDKILTYLNTLDLPDLSAYIDDKRIRTKNSMAVISLFHEILFPSVSKQRSLLLNNKEYLLYKIQYYPNSDLFQLLLYPIGLEEKDSDILFLDVSDNFSLQLGQPIKNYDLYCSKASECIKSHMVEEPVLLQINTTITTSKQEIKESRAEDRCSYMFSSFNTRSYLDGNHFIMQIHYYDFQYAELLDNILSLGKYVKVLSPDSVISAIKEHLFA